MNHIVTPPKRWLKQLKLDFTPRLGVHLAHSSIRAAVQKSRGVLVAHTTGSASEALPFWPRAKARRYSTYIVPTLIVHVWRSLGSGPQEKPCFDGSSKCDPLTNLKANSKQITNQLSKLRSARIASALDVQYGKRCRRTRSSAAISFAL